MVQLSTVVAALSQAAQSSLMVPVASCIGQLKWPWLQTRQPMSYIHIFDEATRGPNGSVWLLWRLARTIQP